MQAAGQRRVKEDRPWPSLPGSFSSRTCTPKWGPLLGVAGDVRRETLSVPLFPQDVCVEPDPPARSAALNVPGSHLSSRHTDWAGTELLYRSPKAG